jgi:hypothetical protein
MEIGSVGDYERMSGYVAFRRGDPTRREEEEGTCLQQQALPMAYVMPDRQQGPSNTMSYTGEYYDDVIEHNYEYIR